MAKIDVVSKVKNRVGVVMPEIMFRRTWEREGQVISIEEEKFEVLLYDPGFYNMLQDGTLYIEDMEIKKKYGLEPDDAEEPVNIIVLDDKARRRYMTALPLREFEEAIGKLSLEQLYMLADYAVDNRLADFEKCEIVKKACGRDIIKNIQLRKANEAED